MHPACLIAARAAIAMLAVLLLQAIDSVNLQAQTLVAVSPFNDPAVTPAADYSPSDQPLAIESVSQPNAAPSCASAEAGNLGSGPAVASSTPTLSKQYMQRAGCQCSRCRNHTAYYRPHQTSYKRDNQALYWGYPEYFCEPPVGASVVTIFNAHKALGDAEQTILFRCDFYPESSPLATQLNYFGKRRFEKLTSRSIPMGVPLRIESSPYNPELDEFRRQFVLEHSSANNLGWTPDRVVLVGEATGITGLEALIQYKNQLTQATSGPSSGSSSSQPTTFVPGTTANAPNAP